MSGVLEQVRIVLEQHGLAAADTPVLLMVSGGSDSTALAYLAADLHAMGLIGPLAMLHVNHKLRGADSDADAVFVGQLAELLGIPLTVVEVEVGRIAEEQRGNVEAVARRERYAAARDALAALCEQVGVSVDAGRLFTAHTADDRIENFYMRSIVGTGPGGFRSMLYLNGRVARPLLECGRGQLRAYLDARAAAGLPIARDDAGALWREDATNQSTDRFRTYVRHEMVPRAVERNPRLLETLTRTMNLIADEDDFMAELADAAEARHVEWLGEGEGCLLAPGFGTEPLVVQRRVVSSVLAHMLGADERIDTRTINTVLGGFANGAPISGYVNNIQGDLAVSANKRGMRIEPMAAFRARRRRG